LNVPGAPGDVLQYTITAVNVGGQGITSLVVNDSTPAYTTFVSAACPVAALPAGMTACNVTTQPTAGGTGAVVWTFTGTLTPGASVVPTYQVKINP
jgi:uncharacterized repeat protein (TIGR01451 family)